MGDFIPFDGRQDLIEFTDGDFGDSYYYSADGDEYYNAKGEKVKDFFKKFKKGGDFWGKGVGKGISAVAKAIGSVSRKILGKSKEKDKGTKEERKADRDKRRTERKDSRDKRRTERKEEKELQRQQNEKGETTYQQNLAKADANTPDDKKVKVGGETYSTEGVPKDKQVVVTTDQKTGEKSVGVEYKADEVVAVKGDDGNYSYYKDGASGGTPPPPPPPPKMSTTTKIAIAVGGVAVLGVIVYLIAKKK